MSTFRIVSCRRCRRVVATVRNGDTAYEAIACVAECNRYLGPGFSWSVSRGPQDVPGCACHEQREMFARAFVPTQGGLFQ